MELTTCLCQCIGDSDCDCDIDFDDINPFVLALSDCEQYRALYPHCVCMRADCNHDGVLNFDDVNPFVDIIASGSCPPHPVIDPPIGFWCGQSWPPLDSEGCGADTNGGCNAPNDPNAFTDMGTLSGSTNLCGALWVDGGWRDSDWFKFTLTQAARVRLSPTNGYPVEIPFAAGLAHDGAWGPPSCQSFVLGGSATQGEPRIATTPERLAPGTYWLVVQPAFDANTPLWDPRPCADPVSTRYFVTLEPIVCPNICGTAVPEGEPVCGPDCVDTFNGGCDAATFAARNVTIGTTGHCGKVGTFTVAGTPTRDYDWWKVTLTGTANARLKIGLRTEAELNLELYAGLDPTNPNCAARTMLDWYKVAACEATVTIYTPCLQNPYGGSGAYYIRVYTTETNVSCTATAGNTYKMTVTLEESGCTLCALTCYGDPDDPCRDEPNDWETNDPCNDPNFPGIPMAYPIGNYPTYGAKQCGRISTFLGAGDTQWVERDFFAFTMPAGKTKLYIRGKAQFRMTIRLFDTDCAPINDPNGVQRTAAWDRACSLTSVQSLAGLTAGKTYWAEIVYGNGLNGTSLKEWFEGLPCAGEPYSAGYNRYEVELAGGT